VAVVKYSIAPEGIWEAGVVKKAACHLFNCAVDSFSNSILRWRVRVGLFMVNSPLNEVRIEFGRVVFASTISAEKVDLFPSYDFGSSDIGLECIKCFVFGFL
jgi:hypothetical protein